MKWIGRGIERDNALLEGFWRATTTRLITDPPRPLYTKEKMQEEEQKGRTTLWHSENARKLIADVEIQTEINLKDQMIWCMTGLTSDGGQRVEEGKDEVRKSHCLTPPSASNMTF